MKFLDKIYLTLFTKSAEKIISAGGHFEFNVPLGFRFKKAGKMYQILDPNDKTFLFQWSGHVLKNSPENQFDIDLERTNAQTKNPSATIQKIGSYNYVCSVTLTKDDRDILHTYITGDKNKRLFVTLLIEGHQKREIIDQKSELGRQLIERLKIQDAT